MRVTVPSNEAGIRLDVWLHGRMPDLSRARIQALIKGGHVVVAGRRVVPHRKLAAGDEILVEIPPAVPVDLIPEPIALSILHEDSDIVVIDKQPGLVVHPAAGHVSGTLVNALLHHCHDIAGVGGELRPGIVHRLDKDTSGAMVVAKNESAMLGLAEQFKRGDVRKEYVAIVRGVPSPASGRLETLIGRSPHDRKKMSARPASGRVAVTNYRVEEAFGNVCLLRIRIETGRTHQIRVHMAHIGHPVVGDRQYGGRHAHAWPAADRQMLHAALLAFRHPRDGRPLEFKAPIPADMLALLARLRAGPGAAS
jgi:23S rRNA pseudouridine1911/1915/1917 synthase